MNPIDNHFSKKLQELEIKPSERANQLFNKKLMAKPEPAKPLWKYFAMAASVLIALGFLFGLYINSEILNPETAAVVPASRPEESETVAREEAESAPEESMSVTEPAEIIPAEKEFKMNHVASIITRYEEEKPAHEFKSFAENQRKKVGGIEKLSPEIRYKYQSSDLTDYTIIDVHPEELEVPYAEESKTVFQVKEKPLIAKVVNEIKYVLHGEKLDLDRAGIRPAATALAHNQAGFIAGEAHQLRENVNRIKEVFK